MTCPSKVRGITGSVLVDSVLQPFIDMAGSVIEQLSECTATLTTGAVDNATTYLAAHFLTTSPVGDASKQVRRETLDGKYSVEYLTPFNLGAGVLSTQYGQAANMILKGCLAEMDKTPVSINVIGSIGDDA